MSGEEFVFGGDSTDIPDATYPAVLKDIEDRHSERTGNDYRSWTFAIEGHGELRGATSVSMGSKSFTAKWIQALTGTAPQKGDRISKSSLIGRPCLVVVSSERTGWPEVDNVLPPLGNIAATPATPGVLP